MSTYQHLTVFGATRGTGVHVVRQALSQDLDVNAVARRPSDVLFSDPRLVVHEGDLLKPSSLGKPIGEADAVIFLAGPSRGGPATLYSEGGGNVIAAMRSAGVRRVVAVTAALVDQPNDTFFQRQVRRVVRSFFKQVQADRLVFEDLLRSSGLDWTVVRPPQLTDKPARGSYRTALDTGVRGGVKLSRADLAHAILSALDDPRTIGRTVDVAY